MRRELWATTYPPFHSPPISPLLSLPTLSGPLLPTALLTSLHPQQKQVTTDSDSSQLLQVPAPPPALLQGHWGSASCPLQDLSHLPRLGTAHSTSPVPSTYLGWGC